MKIGELARKVQVNIQTIRYYERMRLLAPEKRTGAGYREYGLDSVRTVRFIKRAQALGFSLKEVSDLLRLRVTTSNCSRIRGQAEQKMSDVNDKIKDLRRIKRALKGLITHCDRRASTDLCPILDALEK